MEITLLKTNEQKNEDLLIKTRKLSISKARRSIEKSFFKLSAKIPRHIISIDEKYLRHCLELIYVTASLHNPSWEPNSSKIPVFPVMTNNLPMISGHEDGEWIVGSITRGKSILNILKSPFYQKVEAKPVGFESGRILTTKSTVSDSSSSIMGMGMVQLTWKAGSPHLVFLLDGRREAYMAKRTSDSVYVFHGINSEIVGRMRVSQTDSEIKETEFVLFGVDNDNLVNMTKPQILKKKYNNGLQRKISRVFKNNHFSSQEPNRDSCVWPRQDDYFVPNLELIAVVVKEQIHTCQREEETKGWGLKFLRKTKKIKEESLSIDLVVPAGFHGGPRKKEGGPSCLLERWRSAGKCDCEGWDLGCSFKLLKTRPTEISSCYSQPRSSFDLFIQGSSESAAAIKIANVADSLYITHFESGISALQTFATAVAIIHCRSPQLKTQQYEDS